MSELDNKNFTYADACILTSLKLPDRNLGDNIDQVYNRVINTIKFDIENGKMGDSEIIIHERFLFDIKEILKNKGFDVKYDDIRTITGNNHEYKFLLVKLP